MPKLKLDYVFLFTVLALCAIGLIMIFSASPAMGLKQGDGFFYIKRHLFYLLVGFAALVMAWRLDLAVLKKRAHLLLAGSVVLLLLVYLPGVGHRISGAARWIDLGILSFQPSELLKFTTILFLAKYLADHKARLGDFWRGLVPPLLLIGAVAAIIIIQPDLGTTLAVIVPAFCLLFLAGAELKQLGGLALLGLLGLVGLSVSSPYRLRRLLAYLDPWQDPRGIGYQIIQSLLAIGPGGIFGRGLGASRQKILYLPQQFTDFIFAILCEELGLIGGVVVVGLFVALTLRGYKIAREAPDDFTGLLAAGLVSWLVWQALINLLVVVGLVPTTGIPLPFISYGGTAIVVELFSVGIILKIAGLTGRAK